MDLNLLPLVFSLILTVASGLLHLSLPRWFPLFVLVSCVCQSLQCQISTLTQGGGGGHFFRLTCSVALWGGRDTQTNNTGVCSQCLSHMGPAPTHGACALPAHTAQAVGCSAGDRLRPALGCMLLPGLSRAGSGTQGVLRAFCALPRSQQLK